MRAIATAPNWAEELTGIATAIGALGLLGAIGAAIFAGQQVREARKSTQAQMAAEFLRRWNDDALVEARRLRRRFDTKEALSAAFQRYVAENRPEADVLHRELDYFEQLGALEQRDAFDFELIKLLLGRTLVARWEMWEPSIRAVHGPGVYPLFEALAVKVRQTLGPPSRQAARDGDGGAGQSGEEG